MGQSKCTQLELGQAQEGGGVDVCSGIASADRSVRHTACWTRNLAEEMMGTRSLLHMRTDCKSLVEATRSLRQQVRERRLTAELWALREALDMGEITSLEHTSTTKMIADGLTKSDPKLRTTLRQAMAGELLLG